MMDDKALAALLQKMTLEQKAMLCSGADAWTTKPIPALGIPALRMADGPHGVRYEDLGNAKLNGGYSRPSTCFPPEVILACSWNPVLTRRVGEVMAEECLYFGVGMLLGPGVNVKRSPLGGRNFEYYSEDPLLGGLLGAGMIAGTQSRGVATSIKHFAVNSQETKRMSINAAVDDRALFDLYLKAFEVAIRKAQPATVMASYNRVNGQFACENWRLLSDILRLRFGFTGAVVSDWGAVNDRVAGLAAGLDLEMAGSGGVNDYAIVQAVKSGQIDEHALDTACWNLLRLIFTYSREGKPAPECDFDAHHALAADALAQSAVLLKNDDLLPLAEGEQVAIIGEMASKPRYQGGGSSVINPRNLLSFVSAMQQEGFSCCYAAGYEGTETNDTLLAEAVQAAKQADKAVVFLGLPDQLECEGYDRTHLCLPESQLRLLDAVAQVNKNICVVLCCGAPVEAPWLDKVSSLLYLGLGGEGVGEAALRLLYGRDNPAGKLAESWPLALADTPCVAYFPMGPSEVTYNESIFCGYRYYDTAQKPVLFPFGYGLSYTTFAYSELHLSHTLLQPGQDLEISCTITNTGQVAGKEIVQAYAARTGSAAFQPAHELRAFGRVALAPGESRQVNLRVPYRDFGMYDTHTGTHVVEAGQCGIQVGGSSRALPLEGSVSLQGVLLLPKGAHAATGYYGTITDNQFPEAEFAALYAGELLGNRPVRQGEYTNTTTLGEMQDSWWGRRILSLALFISRRMIHFSNDPVANKHATGRLGQDVPFKNMVLNTSGVVSPAASVALLSLLNGRGGFWRFVREVCRRKPYRKLGKSSKNK